MVEVEEVTPTMKRREHRARSYVTFPVALGCRDGRYRQGRHRSMCERRWYIGDSNTDPIDLFCLIFNDSIVALLLYKCNI